MFYLIYKYPFLKEAPVFGRVESIHKTRPTAQKAAQDLIRKVKSAHRAAHIDLEVRILKTKKKKNDLVSQEDVIPETYNPFEDDFVSL